MRAQLGQREIRRETDRDDVLRALIEYDLTIVKFDDSIGDVIITVIVSDH